MVSEKVNLTYALAGDRQVNRLGYGGMQLTGTGVWGEVADRPNAFELLQKAVELGVNFIDTADAYGPFTNETLIADALHPYAKHLLIATKGGFERTGPNKWEPNGSADHIRQAINGSLKRLKVEQIDLWQLHRIDAKVPVEETMQPVMDAVKAGKIKYVGLSEVGVEQIKQVENILPIASVQNLYNLGERKWEEVVDYTASKGYAFIPWYPLASGPHKMEEKINEVAKKHGATIAQVALAWLLKRSENILLIPGTKSIQHLQENFQAGGIELSEDDFLALAE